MSNYLHPCPKPERSASQREYREKAREVCGKIAKLGGICERCGRTSQRGFVMHAAHVIPSRFGSTDCDPDNRVCLCGFCHVADNDSAHLNERDFHAWYDAKYPGRREVLQQRARQIFKGDWADIYETLLITYKCLLEEKAYREARKD